MPENENAVAQEFETPRLSKWLIAEHTINNEH